MITVDKVYGTRMTVLLGMTTCSLAERYKINSCIRQSYNFQPTRRWKQQVAPKILVPSTKMYGVTLQMTTLLSTAVETTKLPSC
jgi:hypothetical protein